MVRVRLAVAILVGASLAFFVSGAADAVRSSYGGTLVVTLGGDPDSLDPTVSRGSGINIYPAMCQQLYTVASNHGTLEMTPVLAAGPPVLSRDKLTYTVPLRRGVLFNDGTPFNAQAVVTTVQRFMTYPASSRASDYASVASVAAAGPYAVVFHMKAPDSSFIGNPYVLSPTALVLEGASFGTNPVCVGPFMFDHWTRGSSVTLVKSPYYYNKTDVYLDKIVYQEIGDPAAAAAALKAGDLQVLAGVDPAQLPTIQEGSGFRIIEKPNLGFESILINVGNVNGLGNLPYGKVGTPLGSSAKLRQAFEEAIDRSAMNRVVFYGHVQPSCTPIPPANTLWFPSIQVPCTPYDPKDARKLVAASGFPSPTVHLLVVNDSTGPNIRLGQFVQAEEAAVGINVVIDMTDGPSGQARLMSGNFDASLGGLEPGNQIDPSYLLYQFFATSGVRNSMGYSSPRMDYVLTNGLLATQLKSRAVNYRVAQQLIETDRPAVVLFNTSTIVAYRANLAGLWLSANGRLHVENAQFKQ
jgi:peptide/nickel transport system substrate-binding protein